MVVGQDSRMIWQNSMGGSGYDRISSSAKDQSGNILITGSIQITNNSPNHHDVFVAKYTPGGRELWRSVFGGDRDDHGLHIMINSKGDVVISGSTNSHSGGLQSIYGWEDIFVVKLNAKTGERIDTKYLGGDFIDIPSHLMELDEGGYMLTASSRSDTNNISVNYGQDDVWIANLDEDLNIIWEQSYGATNEDIGKKTIALTNGTFLTLATSSSYDGAFSDNRGDQDIILINIDQYGNKIWEKCYGGSLAEYAGDILALPNGNVIVSGSTLSSNADISYNAGGKDGWIFEIDPINGNLIWEQTLGSTGSDEISSVQLNGNELIVLGTSASSWFSDGYAGSSDFWLISYDLDDHSISDQHFFGGIGFEQATCMLSDDKGGFILGGYSNSSDSNISNNGQVDGWIFNIRQESAGSSIEMHPNPSNGITYINNLETHSEISIFSLSGTLVYTKTTGVLSNDIIDISELQSGVYVVKCVSGKTTYTEQLVKL